MKITGSDIRSFFQDYNYTAEEMAKGDMAPQELASYLNAEGASKVAVATNNINILDNKVFSLLTRMDTGVVSSADLAKELKEMMEEIKKIRISIT